MFKIAIVQFPRHSNDLADNRQLMTSYLEKLAPDSDLVLLPEGWLGPEPLITEDYLEILHDLLAKLKAPGCLMVSGAQYVNADSQKICRGFILSQDRRTQSLMINSSPPRRLASVNLLPRVTSRRW